MQKYRLWLLFFFAIFSFTFSMIIWTITQASKAPVHKDESFLHSYQHVDNNFNDMMESNRKFIEIYDVTVFLNDKSTALDIEDIFYSQRVMEKRTNHKDMLNIGQNRISVTIKDKNGDYISDAKINIRVMRTGESYNDINLDDFKFANNGYSSNAELKIKGRWNITGVIEIKGLKGYLFIKTNTI